MSKTEFLYVKPKNEDSKEIFDYLMFGLHSCKVMERNNGLLYLESISKNYNFYVNESDDPNWEFIK